MLIKTLKNVTIDVPIVTFLNGHDKIIFFLGTSRVVLVMDSSIEFYVGATLNTG